MRLSPLTRVFVLGLLLVLQVQQVAASVLDCLHGGAPGAGGCLLHHAAEPVVWKAPGPGALADCQRCVLEASIGGVQPPGSVLPAHLSSLAGVDPPSVPQPHFYRFDPDALLRPPIAPIG
jgi:hypothetical protein